MGWTETYKPKGQKLVDFFYENGVTRWSDDLPYTFKVLDSALVNVSTWYAAVEKVEKATGAREVFAVVILVRTIRQKNGSYYAHNILYKDMDESMGPVEAQCPERILDLLTPTEHEFAKDWRARCRAYHERRKRVPKLSVGTQLHFKEPIGYGEWGKFDVFTITEIKGARVTCSTPTYPTVRFRMPRSLIMSRAQDDGVKFV